MNKNPFYVTTPIYYVNDLPHIGHAYTSIAADVMARFARLQGRKTFFLTGTDEHGQKVENAAKIVGLSSQEFVDQMSQNFKNMSNILQLSYDDFIRTTEERHRNGVQRLWNKLVDKGEIYLKSYSGWYSVQDEAFYQELELVGGKAPTGSTVKWVEEPSYFFRLSKWQDHLLKFYKKNPCTIMPKSRLNEVLSFLNSGLRDLSISRSTFSWGIAVPNNKKHTIYVWVDALSNDIVAL